MDFSSENYLDGAFQALIKLVVPLNIFESKDYTKAPTAYTALHWSFRLQSETLKIGHQKMYWADLHWKLSYEK